ncbi:TetR/AcrR family transcriptional regulator [Motilibacter deserti]|uniref:TetR/AcrR family transcriptional regulator n=1 Tax=Motilibacter deserti TaxID=2714956 RepID=A0ABX0GRD8_9ACTN|nr:TetR/AcrR family transcriptional regulator [Motilibacter deserti]
MARTVDPEKHAARRLHILAAAGRCFSRKGFDATTTADVCAEAGVGSGTLFHYFTNKRALLHALFELDEAEQAERAERALAEADPLAALWRLVDGLVADVRERDYLGLVGVVIQQASRDAEFAALVARTEAATRSALTELVRRCTESGVVDSGHDAEATASWVQSMTDVVYLRLSGDESLDVDAELAVLHDVVSRFLRCAA